MSSLRYRVVVLFLHNVSVSPSAPRGCIAIQRYLGIVSMMLIFRSGRLYHM